MLWEDAASEVIAVIYETQFLQPLSVQKKILPNILTHKNGIFHFIQIRRKLILFETVLCLSNTFSRDLGTGASRLSSQGT